MTARCVLIMAGGTGGHVFPALALARALRERALDVIWLGTERGIEARVVPAAGFPIEWIDVGGVRGKGLATRLAAPLTVARAILQSMRVIWRYRPAVVVGLGGFVTGPGGMAAWLLRRPLVVHEQNAVAGFTNRVLGGVVVVLLWKLRRRRSRRRDRQSGARRVLRGRGAAPTIRGPRRCADTRTDRGRQPRCCAPQ
jgi:UDP-N-acetylglucosamine--N-acetylmuramyl-(pentapeptide) pyrophosphoryl-undecaprenol N-acetylglucosamine transferase